MLPRLHHAASAAVLVIAAALVSGAPARAIEPDALPAAMWWRVEEEPDLGRDPLAALRMPGALRATAEWAPLYVSRDGARFERERRSMRVASPPGPWRTAVELGVRSAVAQGGADKAWLGAEHPLSTTSAFALTHHGRRFDLGAAASAHDARTGLALTGRARLGMVGVSAGWSLLPQSGRTEVRWEDIDVLAEGRWLDQRVGWEVEVSPAPAIKVALGQQALDRRTDVMRTGPGDWIEPALAWRASRCRAAFPAFGLGWRMTAEYGEGRESVRIRRDGTAYVQVVGPVTNGLATLEAAVPRPRLVLRAWAGRWRGDARAALALWPFDELAAIGGTRRIAHSSATLEHLGIALDRNREAGSGVDGGIAFWSLAPRARYHSWQATLMGVGYDDASQGETTLRSALATGARIAGQVEWRGARARLELVQWVPVRIVSERGASEPAPPDGGGAGSSPSAAAGGERGGTIVRFSVESRY